MTVFMIVPMINPKAILNFSISRSVEARTTKLKLDAFVACWKDTVKVVDYDTFFARKLNILSPH